MMHQVEQCPPWHGLKRYEGNLSRDSRQGSSPATIENLDLRSKAVQESCRYTLRWIVSLFVIGLVGMRDFMEEMPGSTLQHFGDLSERSCLRQPGPSL